jgi:hypothetical protein
MYYIIAMPFLFAAIYDWAANKTSSCFKKLEKDGEQIYHFGEPVWELDEKKASKYITIMVICYYPAYPALMIISLIRKLLK